MNKFYITAAVCALVLSLACAYRTIRQQDEIQALNVRMKFLEAKIEAVDSQTDALMDIMKRFFGALMKEV